MVADNKIICGDAISRMKKLNDESYDCILIDPPYNVGVDFGSSKCKKTIDEYVNWVSEWLIEAERILKKTGTLYIYGFSEILAHISVKIDIPHRWLIWHYTNKTTPSAKFWQRSHESIIVAWKGKERIFNLDDVREPYTKTFLNNAAGKKRKNTSGRFGSKTETKYTAHKKGALPRDVIKVAALAGGAGRSERIGWCEDCETSFMGKSLKIHKEHNMFKHPTQKPQELTRRLLMASCPDQGNVLIPFAGSGTECMVARDLGLQFTAFDLNPSYVRMANNLLSSSILPQLKGEMNESTSIQNATKRKTTSSSIQD
jgi:site-specific DNA-methyltransferase (adenine-specific)